MKVRELLQIEVWSKSTTGKILLISAALLVLMFFIWHAYEQYWISPGVRESGRKALIRIDELQAQSTPCNTDFKAKADWADREIKIASEKSHTYRDIDVLFQLTDYLASAQVNHLRACTPGLVEQRSMRLKGFNDKLRSAGAGLKQRLHGELD